MCNTLKGKYKIGACEVLYLKKTVWFKYFPFPYEIWAENNENLKQVEAFCLC